MDLPFKNTVTDKESGKNLNGREKEIDTTPDNDEEAAEQDEALLAINNFNDNVEDDDTSADESDEDDAEESDEESDDEEESKEDEEADDDKSDAEESDEDEEDDSENQDEETQNDESKEDKKDSVDESTLSEDEKAKFQKTCFTDLFEGHKDILPESAKENYLNFFASNNNAFLVGDPHLKALVSKLDMINESLPFKQRLEAAFQLAFPDKITQLAEKRAVVKTEIRAQKVNKSANSSVSGAGSKGKKDSYTSEQLAMAKKMGVKLK